MSNEKIKMSNDQKVKCPECGALIPLTEALTSGIETELKEKLKAEFTKKTDDINREADFLKHRAEELDKEKQKISEEVKYQIKVKSAQIAEQERDKALAENSQQTKALEEELEEKRTQLASANEKELLLRKQQRDLEDSKADLELKVQRTLDEERAKIFDKASLKAAEEQALKLHEKDDLLNVMKKQIDDLKRKAELGSQEGQGEALEKSLQEMLEQQFKYDKFEDVKKGARGADILQTIYNPAGKACGTIIWELKNTKLFMQDWISKLKKDQQAAKSDIAVLMTMTLPKGIENFGLHDDIWVTDYKSTLGLATALRHGLLEVARQKVVDAGKSGAKGLIYDYVTGKEFASHIKLIVSAFTQMQEELEAEKRALTRIWKKREKQLSTVLNNVSGMRGSIEGISQKALPDVDVSLETIGDD